MMEFNGIITPIAISEWRPKWFVESKAQKELVQKLMNRKSSSYWDDKKELTWSMFWKWAFMHLMATYLPVLID